MLKHVMLYSYIVKLLLSSYTFFLEGLNKNKNLKLPPWDMGRQVFLSLFRKNWPHFVTKFTQNSLLSQNYKHKFILLQN